MKIKYFAVKEWQKKNEQKSAWKIIICLFFVIVMITSWLNMENNEKLIIIMAERRRRRRRNNKERKEITRITIILVSLVLPCAYPFIYFSLFFSVCCRHQFHFSGAKENRWCYLSAQTHHHLIKPDYAKILNHVGCLQSTHTQKKKEATQTGRVLKFDAKNYAKKKS